MTDPIIIGNATLYLGDCLDVMAELEANSVDSIVTDPPYGLAFMGKDWDSFKEGDIAMRRNPQMDAVNIGASKQGGRQRACPDYQKRQRRDMIAFQSAMEEVFSEVLRVAKPGAHLLAFGGTRTFHRLVCAIEDAGWEIRDTVMWVYGSGFPKSLDVSKAIDKAAGAEREVTGKRNGDGHVQKSTKLKPPIGTFQRTQDDRLETRPSTEAAHQWSGWGTALKPAWEPIIVARKPLEGTVAANVLKHGTGAINIDGCRVETADDLNGGAYSAGGRSQPMPGDIRASAALGMFNPGAKPEKTYQQPPGRFPANLIHDGSEDVVALFPETGDSKSGGRTTNALGRMNDDSWQARDLPRTGRDNTGSAVRFFYCAKASPSDRGADNTHPTVKPTALMRYLCRLVNPPGGTVLDPFTGSGSTGKAAMLEGFSFIGIEREAEYIDIACRRIEGAQRQQSLDLEPAA
jgi:DNA modification methylase